jgi:hypothetical protein
MNAGTSFAILSFMRRLETVRWVFVIGLSCTFGCSSGEEGTDNDEDAMSSSGGNGDNRAMGGTLLGAGGTQVGAGGQGAVGGSQQSAGGVQEASGGAGVGGTTTSGGAESSGGMDGGGGTESSGGMDGSGGATEGDCPSSPPAMDADCSGPLEGCFYEDCAGEGRTLAFCLSGSWEVRRAACEVSSDGCQPGEYLYTYEGGALFSECRPNPCAPGLITEECLGAEGCTLGFLVEEGANVRCIDQGCLELGCP